jgi:hypothetical protein
MILSHFAEKRRIPSHMTKLVVIQQTQLNFPALLPEWEIGQGNLSANFAKKVYEGHRLFFIHEYKKNMKY